MAWIEWIIAFLPRRFRGNIYVHPAAAIWSGLLEFLVCLGLLIYRYFVFFSQQVTSPELMKQAAEKGGETAVMGSGMFSLFIYLTQPVTILIIYFIFEGAARGTAALISHEILPTLPLALFDLGNEKKKKVAAEIALGTRVPDEVAELTGECELRISSCREKAGWDRMMTVAFNDKLYEIAREETGEPPRRFVYFLRRKPDWKIVRGMHHYSPDEVMNAK